MRFVEPTNRETEVPRALAHLLNRTPAGFEMIWNDLESFVFSALFRRHEESINDGCTARLAGLSCSFADPEKWLARVAGDKHLDFPVRCHNSKYWCIA